MLVRRIVCRNIMWYCPAKTQQGTALPSSKAVCLHLANLQTACIVVTPCNLFVTASSDWHWMRMWLNKILPIGQCTADKDNGLPGCLIIKAVFLYIPAIVIAWFWIPFIRLAPMVAIKFLLKKIKLISWFGGKLNNWQPSQFYIGNAKAPIVLICAKGL